MTNTHDKAYPILDENASQNTRIAELKVKITGTRDLLFHRWNRQPKGSDHNDLEACVYRDSDGFLALPGEYFYQAIQSARQDAGASSKIGSLILRPAQVARASSERSERPARHKLGRDIRSTTLRHSVIIEPELCSLGTTTWDYVDHRMVVIENHRVLRLRPALRKGWQCDLTIKIYPGVATAADIFQLLSKAGEYLGIADFRPRFGTFDVTFCSINQL